MVDLSLSRTPHPKPWRRAWHMAALLVVAALLGACQGDDDEARAPATASLSGTTPTSASTATTAPSTSAPFATPSGSPAAATATAAPATAAVPTNTLMPANPTPPPLPTGRTHV